MLGVVFIHSKFIMSRWAEKLAYGNFNSILSNALQYLISEQIARVCVPVFFFISGFFFFYKYHGSVKSFFKLIKKRIQSILVPYVFWSLFWFFIYWLINMNAYKDYFLYSFFYSLIKPIPYQFWFLQILILCFFLSPLIYWFIKKIKFIFLIALLAIYFLDFIHFKSNFYGVIFFSLGAVFCKIDVLKKQIFSKKINIFIYGVLLIINEFIFLANFKSHVIVWIFLHKLSILIAMVMILNFIFFSKRNITLSSRLNKIINSSFLFFLFAFHEPVLSSFKNLWYQLIGANYNLFAYLLLPLWTVFLAYMIYRIMDRYNNKILKLITGGR
ncbi:acyltransferase family protein [uncultured Polaribacter sp.]|uniref:acyltransferase family protein n=1 Tax=uncultured Polaribacter sp. TaxID=174711 RepID=UPI003390689B